MKFQSWANLVGRLFFRARVKSSLQRRQVLRTRRMSRSQVAEALESRALLAVTANVVGNTLQVKLDAANDQAWISYSAGTPTNATSLRVGTTNTTSGLTNVAVIGGSSNINRIEVLDFSNSGAGGASNQRVYFAGSFPITGTGTASAGLSAGVSVTGIETVDVNRLIRGGGTTAAPTPASVTGNAGTVNLAYTSTSVSTATRLQQAVDFAAANATVKLPNGQFNQSMTIDKQLLIDGVGTAVPTSTTGTRINVASGTAVSLGPNADGSTLQELRISGSVVNSTVGIGLQAGAQVDNLKLDRVAAASHGTGFLIPATAGAAGLTITNSNFSNNDRAIAALADTNISTNESGLTGASLSQNTFTNNARGLLFEKLSSSSIVNSTLTGNGSDFTSAYGINLDLQYGIYAPNTIANNTFLNNGTGDVEGAAVRLATTSATLDGLTFAANTINSDANTSFWGLVTAGTLPDITLDGNTFSGNLQGYVLNRGTATISALGSTMGGVSVPGSATNTQLFEIADKIVDAIDVEGYGAVVLKSGQQFVTPNSFYVDGGTETAKVQRAVNLASTGNKINVQSGAYDDGTVSVDPDNLTVDVEAGVSGFSLQLAAANTITLAGAGDLDVVGNANANTITGNAGNNVVTPGAGADTVNLGGEDDTLLYGSAAEATGDTVDGGSGA
ncbi:MAG: beta strand repeat-containing protein, partial [Planctomycetaceae bacterium]